MPIIWMSEEMFECPSCEGMGEVYTGEMWHTCGLCNGIGALTQEQIDRANELLAELNALYGVSLKP